MRDLVALQSAPVIPSTVRDLVRGQCSWANPPADAWFYPAAAAAAADDEYTYRRLDAVHRHTIKCRQRMEHEAGWNDGVHAPLLDVALGDGQVPNADYRNV